MKKLEFYFDFLSPYSYLAWQWVKKRREDFLIECIPVSLSSIIVHYETKGPAQIESKRNYLFKDCLRFAELNKIPFRTPEFLPFNSLYALRSSLKGNAGDLQMDLIDLIFCKGWGEGKDIGDPEFLMNIFNEQGWDGIRILNNVNSKDMRKALKENIKEALKMGVFGVPTFVISGELFWGNDSIPHLEKFMSNQDSLDRNKFENFIREYPFLGS